MTLGAEESRSSCLQNRWSQRLPSTVRAQHLSSSPHITLQPFNVEKHTPILGSGETRVLGKLSGKWQSWDLNSGVIDPSLGSFLSSGSGLGQDELPRLQNLGRHLHDPEGEYFLVSPLPSPLFFLIFSAAEAASCNDLQPGSLITKWEVLS